jgi:hypothetical protein
MHGEHHLTSTRKSVIIIYIGNVDDTSFSFNENYLSLLNQ